MHKNLIDYIATQTEDGFQIVFNNPKRAPMKVSFYDLQTFIQKLNIDMLSGKKPNFTEEEEVLLTLWQMLLIPENTVH
jgi:hypothetical protein